MLLITFVAMNFIQARINPMETVERAVLPDAEFQALKQADLSVLISPYLIMASRSKVQIYKKKTCSRCDFGE